MYTTVQSFFEDNYLPPKALKFNAFVTWVGRSGPYSNHPNHHASSPPPLNVDELHRQLCTHTHFGADKSLGDLIGFVLHSMISHERTIRR